MTSAGPVGIDLLRSPRDLPAADQAGLLVGAACAGAQVRAVAAQLADLPGTDRPRAVVVVGSGATTDAALLAALLGNRVPVPVVAAADLPAWVGPLDLVVVLAAGRNDESAARSAAEALRRGAVTHVRAAAEGPVAEAAGPALRLVELAVPEGLARAGRLSLLAGVAARAGLLPEPDWAEVADLLDATALAVHPTAESFVNPAVNLAEYLCGGVPVLIGCDPEADAVAGAAVEAFTDVAGVPATALTSVRATGSPLLLTRTAAARDLFDDPYADHDDAMVEPPPSRPVLLSIEDAEFPAAGRPSWLPALRRALPNAPIADAGVALPSAAAILARMLAVSLQLEVAAVYLGLALGQRTPPDYPDGLGRSGGTKWAAASTHATTVDPDGTRKRTDSWN